MLPTLFAATLFVGATLLFLVQPLVGRLLLPLVGGTPGVWNTCMVFFPAVLLCGYLYAHRSVTRFGVRRQAVFHLGVLVLVVVAFKVALLWTGSPMPVADRLVPGDQDYPVLNIIALLAVAVGVPYFVLSTTSPLLQRWFSATGHPSAKDPYFLYVASNVGSLLGLLAYPLLIEPRLTLATQQTAWAIGVGVYLVMVCVCAAVVMRRAPSEADSAADSGFRNPVTEIPPRRIWRWVGLAALPSSLMLGVTTHVTSHLAPVPLLWVVPLALYLLSFILVFARWPDGLHWAVGRVTPLLLVPVALTLLMGATEPMALVGGLHLVAFFAVCLVCHGELAKDRPPPEHLTRFYLWMSFGGVLGGTVNALLGPVVFQQVGMVEYPAAVALAALVRPGAVGGLRRGDVAWVAALLIAAIGLALTVPKYLPLPAEINSPEAVRAWLSRSAVMYGLPCLAAFLLIGRPARYSLALAAVLLAGAFDPGQIGDTLHKHRNFFGVVRVTRSPDGKFVRLMHGTAIYGQQRADESGPPRPMTHYHQEGPVGHLFESIPEERVKNVGVVGLGTGAVASYAKPGQAWVFYEIDPSIARIAENPDYFKFLSTRRKAGIKIDVKLGDARRLLAREPDGHFDVILLDAFSSDSVPIHLLTREAVQLYVRKLAPDGVLALHVSNQHLDLPALVARLAADHDPPLSVLSCHDIATALELADGKTDSRWMVLARTSTVLEPLSTAPPPSGRPKEWKPVPTTDGPVWRDDFANLLKVWKRE